MRKLFIAAAAIGILSIGATLGYYVFCTSPEKETKKQPTIKIASFNIQAFGKSKRENKEVMDILETIIKNFDITSVQEVRDKTEATLPYFVSRINSAEGNYAFVASPRSGRTSSKEQYAFIYNANKIQFTGKSYAYNDTGDIFEREPFIANFRSGDFDYTLIDIHTKPDKAKTTNEIQALEDVIKDAEEQLNEKDIIILGDFNADGDYFSESIATGLRNPLLYKWIIPDNADTTVKSTVYAYDRIVFRKQFTSEDFTGEFGVFNFKEKNNLTQEIAEKVSDHFPVYATFYTTKDTD